MYDKVCQKRRRCAPPFLDNLEKNGGGGLNNPPSRAKVKRDIYRRNLQEDGSIPQRGSSLEVIATIYRHDSVTSKTKRNSDHHSINLLRVTDVCDVSTYI